MYTFPLLCFAAAAFVTPEVVHSEDACATIAPNISTVPFQEGYNATLTFTISNQCTGRGVWVKTVKVFADTDTSVITPTCQIFFNKTEPLFASGCTYDPITHSGTITKYIIGYQDENWKLIVILNNRQQINTTVDIRANSDKSVPTSGNNLVVAVSVSTVVVIFLVTIAIVFYVKKVSQGVEMRNRAKDSSEIDDQCVNRLTAAEISNVMYRGSNVSLMICNDIYDATENVTTK